MLIDVTKSKCCNANILTISPVTTLFVDTKITDVAGIFIEQY